MAWILASQPLERQAAVKLPQPAAAVPVCGICGHAAQFTQPLGPTPSSLPSGPHARPDREMHSSNQLKLGRRHELDVSDRLA